MAKRTKFSKFRELYEVIEDLASTYTYEGVVEILAERYDLKLTTGTLTNYLYRHRKKLLELSVATDNSSSKFFIVDNLSKQVLDDSRYSELAQVNDTDFNNESDKPMTHEEIDADLADFKRKQGMRKSLFDR